MIAILVFLCYVALKSLVDQLSVAMSIFGIKYGYGLEIIEEKKLLVMCYLVYVIANLEIDCFVHPILLIMRA